MTEGFVGHEIGAGANKRVHRLTYDGSRYVSACREKVSVRHLTHEDITCTACIRKEKKRGR